MSTLRGIDLHLELGQEILVGPNGDKAKITKIEFHEKTGEISINTTRGPRKVLTFRLCEESREFENPADRYRQVLNNCMKALDFITEEDDIRLRDWQATRSLCKSSKPNSALGASALASCKSQGYRRREGNKSHKLGVTKDSRAKVGGKKIKGKKYGGPLPDWS